MILMAKELKVGVHVTCNSEAGYVSDHKDTALKKVIKTDHRPERHE